MSSELPDQHCVKRRRRPAKSCDACRARKVRCDQKIPCGPCTKARSAPKCIYGPNTVRLPSPDPSPEESGSGAAAPHTPAEIRHYTPEASSLSGKTEAEQLRRQIARLQNRVVRLESRLEADAVRSAATPATDLRVAPIRPKLRQTVDKNKLFGANHWIHTAKHINAGSVGAKDVELSFETPKMDFAKIRQEVTKRRLTIQQFEMPVLNDPIADIIATIPTRSLHSGTSLAYADTIKLANALKAHCAKLSGFFDIHSKSPLVNNFHRSFLDIQFRLHVLRLHRQFLLQQPDEASCFLSRKACFDAAMVIASYASHTSSSDIHLRRLSQLFLNTTGTMRAPLSLEIITMLGLELRMQLEEDDSHDSGPSGQFAKAAREPIFEMLARIRDEFLRRIEMGSPRCKAFGLTSFIIAQLRAMERQESPAQALSNAVTEKLADVQRHLEATVERLAVISAGGDAVMGDFDLDALLAMDFNGGRGWGGFDFVGFGMGDSLW